MTGDTTKYIFEKVTRQHDASEFDCDDEDLNRYIKQFAVGNSRKDYGQTYVCVEKGRKGVCGYYTIANGAVELDILPFPKGMPRRLGVVLLGRWAVDKKMQGQGIGDDLMMHALKMALEVADRSGAYAVTVDALNDRVKETYIRKYDFQPFLDDALHLFLPMSKIRLLNL